MTERYKRETLYRGDKAMSLLSKPWICILGVGAIGSNLAVHLARSGVTQLYLIDSDKVEESNLGTQAFALQDVGSPKAEALAYSFDVLGIDTTQHMNIKVDKTELGKKKLSRVLEESDILVDCFDNSASRQLIFDFAKDNNPNCLHAGVNGEYGEVKWQEVYKVPGDGGVDACNYPLSRTLVQLIAVLAGESIIRYILKGNKESYSLTLQDFKIDVR